MGWKAFKVVFQIKSPIHIGHRKYSNLMQTRPYVPARVILGSLTARITRRVFGQTKDWKHYRIVGEALNRILTTSYFYPTVDEKGRIEKFPWEDAFPHYKFIGSYVSTALDNENRAALEGSLHEVEYISPRTRDIGEKVYLSGYFFIRQDIDLEEFYKEGQNYNLSSEEIEKLSNFLENIDEISDWKNFVQSLQIGGERGYGWGFIERKSIEKIKNDSIFGKYELNLSEDRPIIKIPENGNIPAHLIANSNHTPLSGNIEPLVRREWRDKPGSTIVFDGIAYEPGARAEEKLKLSIGVLGYLYL